MDNPDFSVVLQRIEGELEQVKKMDNPEFRQLIEDRLRAVEDERQYCEMLKCRWKEITFWRWKAEVMVRVLKDRCMQVDCVPVYGFDLDSPLLREWFEAGETVDQVVARADETFEKAGWDDWGPHNWYGYGAAVDPVAVGQSIPRGGPDCCGGGDMLCPGDAGDCW